MCAQHHQNTSVEPIERVIMVHGIALPNALESDARPANLQELLLGRSEGRFDTYMSRSCFHLGILCHDDDVDRLVVTRGGVPVLFSEPSLATAILQVMEPRRAVLVHRKCYVRPRLSQAFVVDPRKDHSKILPTRFFAGEDLKQMLKSPDSLVWSNDCPLLAISSDEYACRIKEIQLEVLGHS
jgi:hypothetical protein